jgi:hypothetical protein
MKEVESSRRFYEKWAICIFGFPDKNGLSEVSAKSREMKLSIRYMR